MRPYGEATQTRPDVPWTFQAEKPKVHALKIQNSMSVKAAFSACQGRDGFSFPSLKGSGGWHERRKENMAE